MPEIMWDQMDERFFERGVDRGVLYTPTAGVYSSGVAWNGLTGVTQSPSGAESNKQYADNIPYVNLTTAEEFGATIEALTFPRAFLVHDGVRTTENGMEVGQQGRPIFGFSWRTLKGTAADEDLGYILNMAFGCQTAPSEKAHTTINDGVELTTFSWTLTTTPVTLEGYKPTAIIKVDSTNDAVSPTGLAALEDVLYGRSAEPPRLPLPAEIDTLLAAA